MNKEVIVCTKDQLERMLKLAYCDGQNGVEFDYRDYVVVIE